MAGNQEFISPRRPRVIASVVVVWWGLWAGVGLGGTVGAATEAVVGERESLPTTAGLLAAAAGFLAVCVPLLPTASRIGVGWTPDLITIVNLTGEKQISWGRVVALESSVLYVFPRDLPVVALRTNARNVWEHTPVHASLSFVEALTASEVGRALVAECERRGIPLD